MKCPNCGAEMQDGLLYCEKCGEDIHIVPDFEPELEHNMQQSLKQVQSDVEQTQIEAEDEDKQAKRKKIKLAVSWAAIVVLVLTLIIIGVNIFHYYSLSYQVRMAKQTTAAGQYKKAIKHYNRAMELDCFDVDLKLGIAQVYFLKNDKENYEYWLREIVFDPNANVEQLESVYGKLIAIYRAGEDYQTISDMLRQCPFESIKDAYKNYLAENPQVNVEPGTYSEVKALKLAVSQKGRIYYTLDGSDPDPSKILYTAPILLESGDYDIRAVFLNENGVASEIISAKYFIDVEEMEEPEIDPESGDYDTPMTIFIANDPGNVYYTTDGSVPNVNSLVYTGPIQMPLGVSIFRFVRMQYGATSAVVDRSYELDLHTDFTPEIAVDIVRGNAIARGVIYDDNGRFDATESRYQYHYLYVVGLEDGQVCYIIAEELVNPEGLINETGNYFAVNAYTGELHRVTIQNGVHQLISE